MTLYDAIGSAYVAMPANERMSIARRFLRAPAACKRLKVLDLGCGAGEDVAFFEQQEHEVYGIDLSPFMIAKAKEIVKQKERVWIDDLENLNTHASGFDYIFANYSLHYTRKHPYVNVLDIVYDHVTEKLKRGGIFAFVIPNPDADRPYAKDDVVKMDIGVPIEYAQRSLDEYLSPLFLHLFQLKRLRYFGGGYTADGPHAAMILVAQKKSVFGSDTILKTFY
jgi:SAM-dependent methyltransferase